MTEHESSTWFVDGAHVGAREALGGVDFEQHEIAAYGPMLFVLALSEVGGLFFFFTG